MMNFCLKFKRVYFMPTENYIKEPFVVCTYQDKPVVNAIIKYTYKLGGR